MKIVLIAALVFAVAPSLAADPFAMERATMIARIRENIRDSAKAADDAELERVLAVIDITPRELFVAKETRAYAYLDAPLQIGHGQSISSPSTVALMTAAARLPRNANVLDVGTGSGYQAAILSPLARNVASIEIVAPLARRAAKRLRRLGYRNVAVRAGDGFAGWPEHAPFDAIIVAAGTAAIPKPLLDQLKPGGRLVIPIGAADFREELIVADKAADGTIMRCSLGPIAFVPLVGRGRRPAAVNVTSGRTVPFCYGKPVT